MKVSELRPCDNCAGVIAPTFYTIRISQAFITPAARNAANALLGTSQILGGSGTAQRIALAMAGDPDDAVLVFGEQRPALYTDLLICADCFHMNRVSLPMIVERMGRADELESDSQADGAKR